MPNVKKLPKQKKLPKRLQAIRAKIEPLKLYSLSDALGLAKENATAKCDETVDIALNLGIDTKHADQQVRVVVPLPHGTGKTVRIAVFARGPKADEAKEAGADIVGAEDLVDAIKAGNINFDRAIATPDMMGVVGSVAKILGPKGMMPNPKLGSVTMNVGDAVRQAKAGQVEVRAEKAGIVHAGIGKASFSLEALLENFKALVSAVIKARPAGAKGTYLKSVVVTTTQGLACKVDVATII